MKLTKTLLISGIALPATVVPMTTITSCSQAWGKLTPMAVGSTLPEDSPYSGIALESYNDADLQPMSYLQSNYTIKQSSGVSYAYSLPYKFVDDSEGEGAWEPASAGWYNSSSSALNSYAKHKYIEGGKRKTKIVTNARNAMLAPNIDFVTTIAASISSYLDLALQYQATQINAKDPTNDENLNIAWGTKGTELTFDHGNKETETEQNNKFYEFVFALSNLIGAKKSHAMFRTSNVNFNFQTMPIPSYSGTTTERVLSNNFWGLVENSSTQPTDELQYYSVKSKEYTETVTEDGEKKEYKYHQYTYESVPVVINFNSLKKTYLDPCAKSSSFSVNDYYSTKGEIDASVGNRWKDSMPKFTGKSKDECVPTYKSFTLEAQDGTNLPTFQDARLKDVQDNDFVILVNYGLRYYDGDEPHHERDTATIAGITGFIPAYLITNDMFKPVRKDSTNYMLDRKEVASANSKLLGILRRTSKDGRKAHAKDMSPAGQKIVSILGHLFHSDTTIDTDTFLSQIEF